jgi:hypothetical protein
MSNRKGSNDEKIFAQSDKPQNQWLYLCTQDNISEIWNNEYRQKKII